MRISVMLWAAGCTVGVDTQSSAGFGSGWDREPATVTTSDATPDPGESTSGDGDHDGALGPTTSLPASTGVGPDPDPDSIGPDSLTGSGGTTFAATTSTSGEEQACAAPSLVDDIEGVFFDCGEDGRVGQGDPVGGITCEQVCCVFGYTGCVAQAAQNVPFFCVPDDPPVVGDCSDVFPDNWTYQCLCT